MPETQQFTYFLSRDKRLGAFTEAHNNPLLTVYCLLEENMHCSKQEILMSFKIKKRAGFKTEVTIKRENKYKVKQGCTLKLVGGQPV